MQVFEFITSIKKKSGYGKKIKVSFCKKDLLFLEKLGTMNASCIIFNNHISNNLIFRRNEK